MTSLHRKLFRDLFHMRSQVLAIGAVVTCGIMTFVTMRSALDSLVYSRATYYADYGLADLWSFAKQAPESVGEKIREIPGVSEVATRLVYDVQLDLPNVAGSVTGRFVSLPFVGKPSINGVYIREGSYPDPDRTDEVIVSEVFMKTNHLAIGDHVAAILNGRRQLFRIVASGLSPEFIYEVQGGSAIFPDNAHFGVFWVSRKAMENAFNVQGAFDDIALRLAPAANRQAVIDEVDAILKPYGGLGTYGRDEQVSAKFLDEEIKQSAVTSEFLPTLFLGVAAFLINIVLSRLVSTEREQIALLKAFGYRSSRISAHYLEFAFCAVLVGAIIGTGLGLWIGSILMGVYVKFYHFPQLAYRITPSLLLLAIGITTAASFVGAWQSVRVVLKLPPAEAMRPEAPAVFHAGLLDRLRISTVFSTSGRMVIRDLERKPIKTILASITVAFAVVLLMIGEFSIDSMQYLIHLGFFGSAHEDMTVQFTVPRPPSVRFDLLSQPGVLSAECTRSMPVRLSHGVDSRKLAIVALPRSGTLRDLVDDQGHRHTLSSTGLTISAALASTLHAHVGDTLRVDVLEQQQPSALMVIADTLTDVLGLNAYMDLANLSSLTKQDVAYSEALLMVDANKSTALEAAFKQMPFVSGVVEQASALASYQQLFAESVNLSAGLFLLFAGVLAFGVVYNSGRITLSERGRELASLRVLGFTRREITAILLGQQMVVVLVGIPLGFLLGWLACLGLPAAYNTDLYRMPFVMQPKMFGYSAVVVLVSAMISSAFLARRTYKLDTIEVLKTRE